MATEPTTTAVGIGPGLALLDAMRAGDLDQFSRLHHVLGADMLADSAGELLRRMLLSADTLDDAEGLEELHLVAHGRWSYRDVAVRALERHSPWSLPLRHARLYACGLLSWHIANLYIDDEDEVERLGRFEIRYESQNPWLRHSWVLGIGYALTLIAEELAFFEDADMNERIRAYRAAAARDAR